MMGFVNIAAKIKLIYFDDADFYPGSIGIAVFEEASVINFDELINESWVGGFREDLSIGTFDYY